MIEAVLFDVDGTLVDHRGAALEAVAQLLSRSPGPDVSRVALSDMWWRLERRHMQAYLTGECSFAEQRRRRLREFLPLLGMKVPDTEDQLDAWFATNYLNAYEASWRCYEDVEDCLSGLSSLPVPPLLAVLTNGEAEQQRSNLARFSFIPLDGDAMAAVEAGFKGVWLDRGVHALSGEPTSPDDSEGLSVIRITRLSELLDEVAML